jgi:CxxC motif-containing protein (DUF1111 family)
MIRFIGTVGIAALLVACNGGSDPQATGDAANPAAATAEVQSAPETAMSVRKTIETLRRGGGGVAGGSTAGWTPPPSNAKDPGPRGGSGDAGGPLEGLTSTQLAAFKPAQDDFNESEGVEDGLGPTMNLDSCGGCHAHPAIGGSSPPVNPQIAFAGAASASNQVPSFLSASGPVREVRFVRNPDGSPDGGVHGLFTIAGRTDAIGCNVRQPDFATEAARGNVVFRIPTPLFGAGLIENIPDREIVRNQALAAQAKQALGIRGRTNLLLTSSSISGQTNKNGNDGTIGRFGHKAQNKSLLIFSGEAYNVEMGITNSAFPTERDESDGCQYGSTPNNDMDLEAKTAIEALSSIDRFTLFMRFLAPPKPSNTVNGASADSIVNGGKLFGDVGCALCHTPTLYTYKKTAGAPAKDQPVNLFSDLLLHDMGRGLADGIQQGQAGGREWRSAPLWGLGQRLFFLHDGRTADLRQSIAEHFSEGSEANGVTRRFFALPDGQQQDVLNFLRSL